MRDLKRSDRNKVVLDDAVSGTKIGIYYSTPTASQIRSYRQQSVRRKAGKVIVDTFGPALKCGLEIITGFDEGAFGYDGSPISSDLGSPNYRKDWKELLEETAADVVTLVAQIAFDGVKPNQLDDIELGGEAEDALPLG